MENEPPPQNSGRLRGLEPSALMRLGLAVDTASGPPDVPGYEVLESLGRGGMGEVFLARQESLGRDVALKVLRTDLAGTGWLPERFEREARTMAALHHPNIVTVHDSVRLADGRTVIVMEYVRGGTLRERITAAPDGLPLGQSLAWFRQIAAGLRVAHEAGIVHRDIKPENVLVDSSGAARVSDFGMAFSGQPDATRYTQTGTSLGTVGYMAPEQFRGGTVDARSDIFSLGAMLYEMLTGRLPQGSFSPVRELRPEIPAMVDTAIQSCLRPDPERRPPDVASVLKIIDEPRRNSPLVTRRRALLAGAAVALVAADSGGNSQRNTTGKAGLVAGGLAGRSPAGRNFRRMAARWLSGCKRRADLHFAAGPDTARVVGRANAISAADESVLRGDLFPDPKRHRDFHVGRVAEGPRRCATCGR